MKKLIKCLALLITCVLLASCDRGRGKLYIYKDLTIQDVDYWANYETGDSIAFVNEQNDSMVFILERYNRYTDPTQEEDGVDKEGTDDFYDIQRSIEIGIKGKSNHNYLNLPIEMEQLMTIVNQVFRLEVVITEIDHPRSKTWHVFSRKA
ncbi:MAG: hypothetical protein Q4D14_06630 [Bacteroidales bacterium]|nr:hypothetical protein [Bacteroidales bacterium]